MKIRFLFIFLLFPLLLIAQEYSPSINIREFAPIGAEWYYGRGGDGYDDKNKYFVVEKDTVVNGKTCRLIRGDSRKEIVFEENGSVYYFFDNKFRKIYDFNVNVGDTIDFEFKTISEHNYFGPLDTTIILPCRIEWIATRAIDGVELREISSHWVYYEESPIWGQIPISGHHTYIEKMGVRNADILDDSPFPVCPGWIIIPEAIHILRCYQDSDIRYGWAAEGKPCDYNTIKERENANGSIVLFPNPVYDRLSIQIPDNINSEQITVALYNNMGKFISKKEYFSNSLIRIDVSNLTPGLYFLKISNKNNIVLTNKFIKL